MDETILSEIEKLSFVLHCKNGKLFYKGPHYTEWIGIEDYILATNPQGKPNSVIPEFCKEI